MFRHKFSYVRTIGENWFKCDDTKITKLKKLNIRFKEEVYIIIFENIVYIYITLF